MRVAYSHRSRRLAVFVISFFAIGCDSTQGNLFAQREPRLPAEYNTDYRGPSAGPSPGYTGAPPRSQAGRRSAPRRESSGYTYRQDVAGRSERGNRERAGWSPAEKRSVREADYEAQEALRRAQFEVDRAFEIANEFARRWAGEELDLARRHALEGIRIAQDNTARAMQEAARRSGEASPDAYEPPPPADEAPPTEPLGGIPFEESDERAYDRAPSDPEPSGDEQVDGARG